jgi:hypothetical protein
MAFSIFYSQMYIWQAYSKNLSAIHAHEKLMAHAELKIVLS